MSSMKYLAGILMSVAREAVFNLEGPFGRRVVGAAGGRGKVVDVDELLRRLADIDKRGGTTSQVFDASRVAGVEHLVHAARSALIARATKDNFASSMPVELVCRVAAERQIGRAFDKLGVRPGGVEIALLTVGASRSRVRAAVNEIFSELGIERDDKVLELKREKFSNLQRTFSIAKRELEVAPIQKLILERIALLATSK